MIRRHGKMALVVVLVVALLAGAGLLAWLCGRMPKLSGALHVDGLRQPVTVTRDQWGVPHIEASGGEDAWFAYGFTLAQDRLFQMEVQRRVAKGELSEIFGPSLLSMDRMFRSLMFRHTAARYFSGENRVDPDILAFLDAFLAGINRFAATGPLPVEFALLGFTPEAFTREDSIAMAGYMAYAFADGIKRDSLYTILKEKLPQTALETLFPQDASFNPVTIMGAPAFPAGVKGGSSFRRPEPPVRRSTEGRLRDGKGGTESGGPEEGSKGARDGTDSGCAEDRRVATNSGRVNRRFRNGGITGDEFDSGRSCDGGLTDGGGTGGGASGADVKGIEMLLAALQRVSDLFPANLSMGEGSNSWVIAPQRSRSGGAILANDPHVGLSSPGVWYEAHIRYAGYENYGYHIPLIPFPLIAHNGRKGWAVTMLGNDDMDLYRETLNPQDPSQVMFRGRWTRLKTIEELIRVKGETAVPFTIRVTPHGPLITDFIKGYSGDPVSLSWTFHRVHNPLLEVLHGMGTAESLPAFEEAVSKLAAPGINISYADADGNIAWWAAGKIAVRPAHVYSKEILEGSSGRDELLGYLPFSENPYLMNPPGGIIVTANNKPAASGFWRHAQGYWKPSDRAERILELLASRQRWDLGALKALQTDEKSTAAPAVLSALTRSVDRDPAGLARFTPLEQKAWQRFSAWDFRNGTSSVGATLFHFTAWHVLAELLEDDLGPENFRLFCGTTDYWTFLKTVVENGESPFWDDIRTRGREAMAMTVAAGFKGAVAELREKFGETVDEWRWGRVHRVEYLHPLGLRKPMNLVFNVGPFPAPGAEFVVNKFREDFAKHDGRVVSGPSLRRLVDYGGARSWAALPTGNSGHFLSPHYDDQGELFIRGEYRPMNVTPKQIEKNGKQTLHLIPASPNDS